MTVNRVMTPTGRQQTQLGNPPGRPPGPTQHLVPVGPPPTYAGVPVSLLTGQLERSPRGPRVPLPRATAEPPVMTVGLPRLDSAFINTQAVSPAIPWTQLLTNLFRLAQPTGVVPGTYAGIIFNAYGQAISASTSGVNFDSATFTDLTVTGTATAPTVAANDNSTNIATTAWVQEQGYATEAYVHDQGFITTAALDGYATEAWVQQQGYITDAPVDGQFYARQNGAWVAIVATPVP